MSISAITQESLKDKAKLLKKFIKEKGNVDVSHGHCLDLISQLFGFKDWNTASAKLSLSDNQEQKPKSERSIFPIHIKTVGDMKKALELFNDTDTIDADYSFKVRDFIADCEAEDLIDLDGEIYQEFSLSLQGTNDDIVTFKLKLEEESMGF